MKKINHFFLKAQSLVLLAFFFSSLSYWVGCKPETNPDINKKITQDSITSKVKPKNEILNQKATVEITNKEIQNGDPKDPKDIKDHLLVTYKLTNNTDKNIKQLDADIILNDLAGNELKKLKISYIEGIPAMGYKEYKGLHNFNVFNEKDALLKSLDLKSIKYDVNITGITYQDGTTEPVK